jgi:N-acetylated-alpha-linked acidic dipeptidase
MKDITDPETKMDVWKRVRLADSLRLPPDKRAELKTRPDLRIGALGSGSDYTVFIDHLGVASINLGFGGEDQSSGQYHSIYDDFYWYTHFEDTDFTYGRALAQAAGTMVMRLAGANVLPFQFANFAETVHGYVGELKKLASDQRDATKEKNAAIDEGAYQASADPHKKTVPPTKEPLPPYLNFAPLENASDDLTRAADLYEKAVVAAGNSAAPSVNARLIQSERLLTDPAGLPNRPWFQNTIYAPGFYTGYGVKTIPGVREAIEQKRWAEVDTQMLRVSQALQREADLLGEAANELAGRK